MSSASVASVRTDCRKRVRPFRDAIKSADEDLRSVKNASSLEGDEDVSRREAQLGDGEVTVEVHRAEP